MTRTASPLRYPGGKASLFKAMKEIIADNNLIHRTYAEPYAGGAGLALALLFSGTVREIHINDLDASIWSFWHSVLNNTEEFTELVMTTELTIDEWRNQRDIYRAQNDSDPLKLGFAAFYLNRTNRSGIIAQGGVIGGLKQTGSYLMDCRFNRRDLVERIRRVATYRDEIFLYRMDALDFLKRSPELLPNKTLLCVDPPYFNKGSQLYTSFYRPEDHAALADVIQDLTMPWIVTYDNTSEIRSLYSKSRLHSFDVRYSVQTKRVGDELLIAPKHVSLPGVWSERQIAS
ncbi:DNA adenine methylase [Thalassovita aquimarina]|uniref:DNA adenine methylase n=1 Tax=Thalassovita aquimarina TaxID=2785917 RepID=A0ABS5HUH3_9RHOB|nr:DNA adenine methylase [Thalassovita aquimarina]MBR9652218.1 DNA adenine methylase [Thalassovita aquimarina]